ncbi:MAG: hypothetical protein GWN84_24685 [Gammaproteobacteria bacterium]|nr:hypothetical protein [Gammaproteobacteria bacterium]NIR82626.1 hypothetical protein [Gammaproteobacteria bacterium]NIR89089.1 hypothetical protein [Gammaproteobacteria bacterium]NIU03860.1 hypothetical protein [Gammaproteobacteria bacterium]NIV74236.1 hypothetical protein [Gammaproteobacteria bacterium]
MSSKLRRFLENLWGVVVGTVLLILLMAVLSVLTGGAVPCVWPMRC